MAGDSVVAVLGSAAFMKRAVRCVSVKLGFQRFGSGSVRGRFGSAVPVRFHVLPVWLQYDRKSLPEEADEPEAKVHDWRFSELRTTDLAALREVDVAAPFRLSVIDDEHWKGLSTTPARHGPQCSRNAWYDAATAHWAALKGLARSKRPTKQQLNSFWFKLYCHGTPKEPEPSALAAALTIFPFQYRDEGVVQYRQIQDAIRTMWHAAQASMKRHIGLHPNWHP